MDQILIDNWNSVVSSNDIVYMLGDFALDSKERIKELVKLLNGRKTLILGNHDTRFIKFKWWEEESGFEKIVRNEIRYVNFNNDYIIMTHYPMTEVPQEQFNIYGHIHNNVTKNIPINSYNVSVENINYTPIELNIVIQHIKDNLLI